jgi:hypothetical protein
MGFGFVRLGFCASCIVLFLRLGSFAIVLFLHTRGAETVFREEVALSPYGARCTLGHGSSCEHPLARRMDADWACSLDRHVI